MNTSVISSDRSILFRVFLAAALLLVAAVRLGRAAGATPDAEPTIAQKAAAATAIADVQLGHPVNFAQDILPIFRSNCVACHNAKESKGGVILETPKAIRTGGESGPAVMPGHFDKSLLMIVASHRDKPFMPPRNNKVSASNLTPEQLGLLKLWVDQGAGGDDTLRAVPIQWHPLPPTLNPIYAIAVTPDGQFAACGRANQIFIYDLPARRLVTRLTDAALVTSPGQGQQGLAHRDLVQSLAFSPDGRTLASGGYREVKLWSRPQPAIVATIDDAHVKSINSIAQSPNGKTLAVAGDDHVIRLYSLPAGKLLRELAGHTAEVTSVVFADGGARLYSASRDKTIRSWPTAAQAAEATVIETPGEVLAMTVLGNGQIVTASDDKFLHLWEDGKESGKIPGNGGPPIKLLAAAQDGKARFISADKNGTVLLWDAATGKVLRVVDQEGEVSAVVVRADGKQCAIVGPTQVARICSLEEARQPVVERGDRDANDFVRMCNRRLDFANSEVNFTRNQFDDATRRQGTEGQAIAQATSDVAAAEKVLTAAKKTMEAKAAAKVAADTALADATAASVDATKIKAAAEQAMKDAAAEAEAFNATLQKTRSTADSAPAGDDRKAAAAALVEASKKFNALRDKVNATSEAFYPLQQKASVAADKQREIEFKARNAGREAVESETLETQAETSLKSAKQSLAAFKASLERAKQDRIDGVAAQAVADAQLAKARSEFDAAQKAAQTAGSPMLAVAFSADGGTLITGGDDGALRTWSVESGAPAQTLHGSTGRIIGLACGAQGLVACARGDGSVQIWDIAGQWKFAQTLGTGTEDSPLVSRVCSLAFSPDSTLLATGGGVPSRTGELKFWNVADGKLVRDIVDAHSDTVFGLSFAADGKSVASCAADKFAKVFNVADGKLIRSYEGHTEQVLAVSYRYDGRALVTGGADNKIKFWNTITGEQKPEQGQQHTFPLQVTSVNYIGFSDTLLVTAGDGTMRLINENGPLRSFDTEGAFIYCSAVTPDGQTILAGGHDSVMRMWDSRDGQPPVKFEAPTEP